MTTDRLPTFVVIGAMKCGTSSLHRYLDAHPQVCMSDPKETDFFLEQNERTLDWYRRCFAEEAPVSGESSPNYTKYPAFDGVPERMHRLLPNAKLVYLVRDPVERAVSHYIHNWAERRETEPPDEALRPVDESWYLTVSRYHKQLSRYLDYYSLEDIRVIEAERLRERREEVLRDLFQFLGVDPDFQSKVFEQEHHTSAAKKRQTKLASFFRWSTTGQILKNAGKRMVPQAVVESIKEALKRDVEKPTPSGAALEEMRAYLAEDVENLRQLTGKPFESWSL
jgi:hypothetical protein